MKKPQYSLNFRKPTWRQRRQAKAFADSYRRLLPKPPDAHDRRQNEPPETRNGAKP
jgi:hypothetical protein